MVGVMNILVVPTLEAGHDLCEAFDLDRSVWKIVPYLAPLASFKHPSTVVVMVLPEWKQPSSPEYKVALRLWYDESLPALYARARKTCFLYPS